MNIMKPHHVCEFLIEEIAFEAPDDTQLTPEGIAIIKRVKQLHPGLFELRSSSQLVEWDKLFQYFEALDKKIQTESLAKDFPAEEMILETAQKARKAFQKIERNLPIKVTYLGEPRSTLRYLKTVR